MMLSLSHWSGCNRAKSSSVTSSFPIRATTPLLFKRDLIVLACSSVSAMGKARFLVRNLASNASSRARCRWTNCKSSERECPMCLWLSSSRVSRQFRVDTEFGGTYTSNTVLRLRSTARSNASCYTIINIQHVQNLVVYVTNCGFATRDKFLQGTPHNI